MSVEVVKDSPTSCGSCSAGNKNLTDKPRSIGVKSFNDSRLSEIGLGESKDSGIKNAPRRSLSFASRMPGSKRMHILCDLDSTLINSLSLKDEIKYTPKEFQNQFAHIDMPGYYRIFERPYLQFFLDFLFKTFDVSVFTAADKDYALFITDNIIMKKPGRKLKYLFYGLHSSISEGLYKSPKDLKLLWDVFGVKDFNPCNTLIIDDLDLVYAANPNTTIPAPKFELLKRKNPDYSQAHDNFLLSIIPILENRREIFLKCPCDHLYGQHHSHPCKISTSSSIDRGKF